MTPEGCDLFDPCLSVPRGIWAVSPPFSLSFFPLSLSPSRFLMPDSIQGPLALWVITRLPPHPPHGFHSDRAEGAGGCALVSPAFCCCLCSKIPIKSLLPTCWLSFLSFWVLSEGGGRSCSE